MSDTFGGNLAIHSGLIARVMESPDLIRNVSDASDAIVNCLESGGKLLVCGNGGSAADAQHIAGELVGRFQIERRGLPAIALSTDASIMTAWGNDYGFDTVFSRQVDALGKKRDILICISTSGNSTNVVEAAKAGKNKGMQTVGLLGRDGGKLAELVDIAVVVDHQDTARIQEIHQIIYHSWCADVDEADI